MFLGKYEYEGDPDELLAGYDRLMTQIPRESIGIHICIRVDGGITIYDTCPTAEVWMSFANDPNIRAAMVAVGLPEPTVTPLGEVHSALAAAEHVI